ncbi:MAG TPA: alpha/beta fold hydrolase, partial [Longimicrobiaceae bacterium]|nr:alpha/beta fold hydrolase [Longimicrobiaceae bacterium]
MPAAAREDAERAPGDYPLVVYIPGAGGSALENVVLAELLASKGYVVAALPSVGADTRQVGIGLRELQTQARDVGFAVGRIGALPGVRGDSVVVAGWSWGGLAATMAQMTDDRIGAVISIDGSIAFHRDIAERYPGFAPWRADVPYLFFVAEERAGAAPGFFNQLRYSDADYGSIPEAGHADFTTRFGYLPNETRVGSDEYDPAVRATYQALLQGSAAFIAALHDPGQAGSRRGTIEILGPDGPSVRRRPASAAPPPTFRLLDELRDSTDAGLARYRALKAEDPYLHLFAEWDLVQLAFDVFNVFDRPDDAIAIGQLLVDEYPASYSAHGYLAELYRKNEDWASALTEFGAARVLAGNGSDAVWTTRADDLMYYEQMIVEITATVAR